MNGKQTVFVTWFCVFLLLSCQFTNIDARKVHSNSRKTGSSSGGHVTRPSTDSKYSNSHADQAKLSYSGYNSAPNPPKAQQPIAPPAQAPSYNAPPLPPKPSAPDAGKPVGWNVPDGNAQKQTVHNTNAAPYPNQGGPPPAYSPQSNVNSHPHDAPPPYQQHAAVQPQYPGAPTGGFAPQQGGFPQQQGGFAPQGGYPQQGGFPQQGGYPQGGFPQQGGYPQQQGGFPVQQGYPVGQPYPVQQQSSSGSGLQTALIAGVGGLALYGALKPSGEKTIIINQAESTTAAAAAAVTPSAAPSADATSTPLAVAPASGSPVPVTPVAPVTGANATDVSVTPVSPLSTDNASTANIVPSAASDGSTPLAQYPVTVTMAPPDVPPYSGSSVHYEQALLATVQAEAATIRSDIPLAPFPSDTPLAPFPSDTPLAPFPSSQAPPICAPGQNPDDPLAKCTPLTVAPMYVTPSTTVDGNATAQKEVSAVAPAAANTSQNLTAQSALKSSAVSNTLVAFNFFVIPILTLLMV